MKRSAFFRTVVAAASGVVICGCPDKGPARSIAAPNPAAPATIPERITSGAEVEFSGVLVSAVKAARFVAFVQKAPCDSAADHVTPISTALVPGTGPFNFFNEVIVTQGTVAHFCAAGIDEKGMLVAFGAFEKNPVTLGGAGEVEVKMPHLALSPVSPPHAAPTGL
jgi:hypothetical protein